MTEITHTSYTPWPERKTADPRVATQAQYNHGLAEIVQYQGPMQALELFQAYGKASGLLKIAASVRRRFEHALLKAEKAGVLLITRETDSEAKDENDSIGWIVRLPNQPPVIVRDLGTRGFAEIPMSELAAVVEEILFHNETAEREEVYRGVLEHYGLQKLTALVKRRLNVVLED